MIQQQLWRRLEKLMTRKRPGHVQHLFVFVEEGETSDDVEARIERWKAGQTVMGISASCEGEEVETALPFEFVAPARKGK